MISFSVAFDPNKGIGYKNVMPWHIKEEFRIFRRNTMFRNIVMGQTTYDNLPGKLKDRYITVVSIDPDYHPEGVEVCNDLIAFLKEHENDETEYIICGGASIYRQAYPYAHKAYISFIKKEYEVDTYFDMYEADDWDIAAEEEYEEFIYRELTRKSIKKKGEEEMQNYVHDIPTKIYFGKGSISHLDESLRQFGKNVLLTYGGGSVKKSGLYDEIMKILSDGGFKVTELSGIDPNPRIETVRKGVEICKENGIEVILAVGGGSTIDCSKAIACGCYYEGDDLWQMIIEKVGLRKALPLVDILTLAATGSEYDGTGVISNLSTNQKMGATLTYPSVSICDPCYTFSVPKYQTAAGSIDIMSHIMEGYFSRIADSDLAEGIAEAVLRSVLKNLPIALAEPDNYSARANLMANSSIACSGIPEYGKPSGSWPCHAMEHELSAYYDITHGVGLAILTPRWMRYILKKDPSVEWRFVKFARNIFGLEGDDEHELALKGIDALEDFFRSTGIPMSLSELGIGTEHFEAMAAHANRGDRLSKGFVALDADDIVAIYKDCL